MAGVVGNGVYTITDTGNPTTDFSIHTNIKIPKKNRDVYILEWGDSSSSNIAKGYEQFIDHYIDNGTWDKYKSAWNKYKEMGGILINFTKFTQDDINIKNHPNYNDK